jgi:hypothetical protein
MSGSLIRRKSKAEGEDCISESQMHEAGAGDQENTFRIPLYYEILPGGRGRCGRTAMNCRK